MSGAVVGHLIVCKGYEITAEDPVIVFEADILGNGFDGCPPGIVFQRVIA